LRFRRNKIAWIGAAAIAVGSAGAAAAPFDPSHTVRFELQEGTTGAEHPSHRLLVTVRVTGPLVGEAEPAAIVRSPAVPRRLVPLRPEAERRELSATVRLDLDHAGTAVGRAAVPIEFTFARMRALSLTPVFSRTIYITLGAASAGGPPAAQPPVAGEPVDHAGPRPVTPGDGIREEPLEAVSAIAQGPVYWKQIERRIRQSWQEQIAPYRKPGGRRSLRVQFRLYPDGHAQLVQIERSSGDERLDAAGLQAVVAAHPFPPLSGGSPDPHVDVHIDLREGNP